MDIAYVPFVERYQPFFSEVKKYDIRVGRPKLALWIEVRKQTLCVRGQFYACINHFMRTISTKRKHQCFPLEIDMTLRVSQEMNKIEAYKQTQRDAKEHVESYKNRFLKVIFLNSTLLF